VLRPATPPPEFDLELAVASVDRIRGADPSAILFSHFGHAGDVGGLCDLAVDRLRRWTDVVAGALRRGEELPAVVRSLKTATESIDVAPSDESDSIRYEFLSSYKMNALGAIRYLTRDRPAVEGRTASG
jgi:hypothetical protein